MTRIEQRPRLRREKPPSDAIVVVQGGRDTVDKLRCHAQRTAAAWQLDGEPLYGVSVYCALDDVGPASLRNILADMHSYPIVHFSTIGAVLDGGFELIATAARPHFTVRVSGIGDDELHRLLALFGQPRENTHGKSKQGRR